MLRLRVSSSGGQRLRAPLTCCLNVSDFCCQYSTLLYRPTLPAIFTAGVSAACACSSSFRMLAIWSLGVLSLLMREPFIVCSSASDSSPRPRLERVDGKDALTCVRVTSAWVKSVRVACASTCMELLTLLRPRDVAGREGRGVSVNLCMRRSRVWLE